MVGAAVPVRAWRGEAEARVVKVRREARRTVIVEVYIFVECVSLL